jgi:hypothetical protein
VTDEVPSRTVDTGLLSVTAERNWHHHYAGGGYVFCDGQFVDWGVAMLAATVVMTVAIAVMNEVIAGV